MQDLMLDIIVSAVFILVGIVCVFLMLFLLIHHMPFGSALLYMLERKMEDIGVVHEKTRSMRRMLDKGRELLRCGDWAGAYVKLNAALMLEPDLAKKISKGYRADLLSELRARGKITAIWQIRRILGPASQVQTVSLATVEFFISLIIEPVQMGREFRRPMGLYPHLKGYSPVALSGDVSAHPLPPPACAMTSRPCATR